MALMRLGIRMVATIIAATALTFFLLEISIPGGFRAAILPPGDTRSPHARRLIEEFHLDDNVVERYVHWLIDALSGDFGVSAQSDRPVSEILTHRLPISIEIMVVGVLVTALIGLPLGILAVAWSRRRIGQVLNALLGLAQSIPVYVTPIFLIAIFAVRLQWLPAAGWVRISSSLSGNLRNLVLPIIALVLAEVGSVARIVRGDVLRVMESDYISAAVGKGLTTRYILFRHALRPASLSLLNVIALNIGALLTGALVIELIFGIGGLGQVLLEATIGRDLYVLLGLTTYAVVVHVGLAALVDALQLMLDPRIRRKAAR